MFGSLPAGLLFCPWLSTILRSASPAACHSTRVLLKCKCMRTWAGKNPSTMADMAGLYLASVTARGPPLKSRSTIGAPLANTTLLLVTYAYGEFRVTPVLMTSRSSAPWNPANVMSGLSFPSASTLGALPRQTNIKSDPYLTSAIALLFRFVTCTAALSRSPRYLGQAVSELTQPGSNAVVWPKAPRL